ncbi:hypothetical protein NS226_10725 [Aureimonas ureilytica]|uniref:Uncharacterized protein n=1 Tax=Aureimonas ureilytica TaxID=401562 RepID=A0A175R8B6_9HYPH|nr:hypothetical protein NS226_10725 [Aureimonas ureilytica]
MLSTARMTFIRLEIDMLRYGVFTIKIPTLTSIQQARKKEIRFKKISRNMFLKEKHTMHTETMKDMTFILFSDSTTLRRELIFIQ